MNMIVINHFLKSTADLNNTWLYFLYLTLTLIFTENEKK